MFINIIGLAIVFAMIFALVKKYESRMVLLLAGFALCILAGAPMDAFKAFSDALKNAKVIEPIVASMGFAYVLKYTECDKHLVHFLAGGLNKVGIFLVPAAVLVTAFINISITSASGCSAAVGAIIIPLLMRLGVHPAIAASTVLLGTYGSANLNPGYAQTIIVSEVSKTPIMDVVAFEMIPFTVAAFVAAASLMAVALLMKEHKGFVYEADDADTSFKVNYIMAIIPLIPVTLLLLGNAKLIPGLPKLAISHVLIIGAFLALLATYKKSKGSDIVKKFFAGMGEGFAHIYGIITCALIFVAGLKAMGFVKALVESMQGNEAIAKIAGPIGAFILATITGSGDAAAISFNQAVTIHAADFGADGLSLGATIAAVAGIGRSMSPIAGAAIICAGYAGVNPIELAKRNAIPTIVTAAVFTISVLF